MKSSIWFPALAFAALGAALAASPVESVAEEVPRCNHKICRDDPGPNTCAYGTIEGTDTQCDSEWGPFSCRWDVCPK